MLSVDRCRQLLGNAARDLSDAEVERLRNQLYRFAEVAVSIVRERQRSLEAGAEGRP
jgi:hypothetical protein